MLSVSILTATILAQSCASQAQACQQEASQVVLASHSGLPTVLEVASDNEAFTTLVAAVGAADLADALGGAGPFTVFAPSNDAFNKLPVGTVEALLAPKNKALLTAILTNHVVSGSYPAEAVVNTSGRPALGGQWLAFEKKSGGVEVDGARVVRADIKCANGVIHVIDTVMLPNDSDLVKVASDAGEFKTLIAAAKAAGLAGALADTGPYTIFAPTDEAFAALGPNAINSLLKPENKGMLEYILKHHVVSGCVYSPDALVAGRAKTIAGTTVRIKADKSGATVNGVNLVATDIDAKNGVIHVIDSVLLPPVQLSQLSN